jgi:hypothetical protein
MKIFFLRFFLSAILLSFPLSAFSEEPNPKIWKHFGNHSYYNIKIITASPGIILVWTYKTITDNIKASRIEEIGKYDSEKSTKYQNYHHENILWNIDCTNRSIKMEEFIDFGANGEVLDRYIYRHSQWYNIVPKSGAEQLYQNVCFPRTKKTVKNKK